MVQYRQLLQTVLAEGILRETESRPIFRVDGSTSRWMLDTLGFSLSGEGSKLAARALLDRLKRFEGRQLATYGTTGIPLMQAVIAESRGRYSGLVVRKELKAHGARLRVQGPPGEGPVILIDDSVASGSSLLKCRDYLEDAGFEVEGAVVLVRFGYDGVAGLLAHDHLRTEAVFDTDLDLRPHMEGEDLPPLNPGKVFPALRWSKARTREGLHPGDLAREAIDLYLRTGELPRPPRRLDARYDGAGGVFVSLRRRDDVHDRPARAGFWNFPEETRGTTPEDLLRACLLTAETLRSKTEAPRDVLAQCAIAVTFFSRLVPCEVGALDNDRYGIVVRSKVRRGVMGGALPRMPGIRDGWRQYRHAAYKNAQVYADEPVELLRHDVVKVVEPGEPWQPTGVPGKTPRDPRGPALSAHARAWACKHLGVGEPPSAIDVSLAGLAQLFVSVYVGGAVAGCAGDRVDAQTDANALIERLVAGAVSDPRFNAQKPATAEAVTAMVSLLTLDLELGQHEASTVMAPTRYADQALEASNETSSGILLPHVVVTHDLSAQEYAHAVLVKAGIADGEATWTRFDCQSWLGTSLLVDGLPERMAADADPAQLGRYWADFLAQHAAESDSVNRYLPFADEQLTGAAPERRAHGAWVMAGAGLKDAAKRELARLPVAGATWPTLAFCALAQARLGNKAAAKPAIDALRHFVPATGAAARAEDEDYAPGQVLYALALLDPRHARAAALLAHYRRRFRSQPAWGSVAWLTLAFSAWSRALKDRRLLDFAVEIFDWAVTRQSAQGGFWNDHQPDAPGALTAAYLEGFAGLQAELKRARHPAAKRVQASLARGFAFLSRLTYLPKDAAILPNPEYAAGGVRLALTSGEVRLDFVQHALSAVVLHP